MEKNIREKDIAVAGKEGMMKEKMLREIIMQLSNDKKLLLNVYL